MKLTWSELIEGAKNGDQDAFYQLYQNSYDAVYRTVKSMIRDDDMAMDIVQDAFVKGFSNLNALDNPESFVPWMRRIAANKAKDWFRKKQEVSFSQLSDDEENEPDFEDERTENLPEEVVDRYETARLIDEILSSLSDEQRIAVGMFYYQNMSVAEIAEELSISENTVKSRLNYGRKKIKARVEELEKNGTKLYSLSPVVFLIFLFRNQIAQAALGGAPEAVFGSIMAKAGAAIVNTASTSAGAGAAIGEAAGEAAAGAAAASANSRFIASAGAKIIAGILAICVAGGAIGIGLHMSKKRHEKDPITESPAITQSSNTPEVEITPEPELNIVVLPDEYEDLKSIAVAEVADYRVALAKKDGKWGAIDETGNVVIPFVYDSISSPSASGHILASQNDAETGNKNNTVYDSRGNIILTTDRDVLVGTDIIIFCEESYMNYDLEYGECSRIEVKKISTGETLLTEEYVPFFSYSTFEDCFVVISATEVETGDFPGFITFYNSNGEILLREEDEGRGGVMDNIVGVTWDGYYSSQIRFQTFVEIRNLEGTESYTYSPDDFSEGSDVIYKCRGRVGPILRLWTWAYNSDDPSSEYKEYLMDVRTLHDSSENKDIFDYFLTRKGYDYISENALEKWFLVYDEEKQGFLSRDGKTERLYDGAGDFVRGKAIVMDRSDIYVIDDSMNIISDKLSGGYSSVKTLGECIYGVEKDGKWYMAVYKE